MKRAFPLVDTHEPRVVVLRLSEHRHALADLHDLLSLDERAEASRFLNEADRARFTLGRGRLKELLACDLERAPASIRIERDGFRRPFLVNDPCLAFNVSHSDDLVAIAVGRCRSLGVDVERHRSNFDVFEVAAAFMTPAELQAMQGEPERRRRFFFFRQWCFKEAVTKALGSGLTRDPRRFEILFDDVGGPDLKYVGDDEDDVGDGWSLSRLTIDEGYSGALAWRCGCI